MNTYICLLYFLSDSILGDETAKETEITVRFEPGKLGLAADWQSGRVTRVDNGGQAWMNGIAVGMVMKRIGEKRFSEELLDEQIAGKASYHLTFSKHLHASKNPKPEYQDVLKIELKYAKRLNEDSFREEVYKIANGTESDSSAPPYYPLVMFYMEYCPHCQKALPEFEKAAGIVEQRIQSAGASKSIFPKFFVFRCNRPAEPNPICTKYGEQMPVIKLFRDHRSILFERSRSSDVIAWWALRVSRPPISESRNSLESRAPLFVLHVNAARDGHLLNMWKEVALNYIEDYTFVYAKHDGPPRVMVKGDGLEPLPLRGTMSVPRLTKWVAFNQFKPIVDLNSENEYALEHCGFPVIALVYDSTASGSEVLEAFETWAKQLRPMKEFIFATADVGHQHTKQFIGQAFPLLSPSWTPPPRIFVFNGSSTYWESLPASDDSQLSIDSIRELIADSTARQDDSIWCWMKEKGKISWRFTTGSSTGFGTSLCVLLACITICRSILGALLKSDGQPSIANTKEAKAD